MTWDTHLHGGTGPRGGARCAAAPLQNARQPFIFTGANGDCPQAAFVCSHVWYEQRFLFWELETP